MNRRGLEFEKRLKIILKRLNEKYHAVMKHNIKLRTEASYCALKSLREYYLQKR